MEAIIDIAKFVILVVAIFALQMFILHSPRYLLQKLLRLKKRDSFATPHYGDYLFGDPNKPRYRNPRRHRGLRW